MRYFLFIFILLVAHCTKANPPKDYKTYTKEAADFSKKHKLSTEFYILVDLSIHSGKKRMFIIDFKTNKIRDSFMVTHGDGGGSTDNHVHFSNKPDSHCSSKGKYILGSKKVPSPGFNYKYIMYGKEPTNSNAVKRNIVFHPWEVVPDEETYPVGIPASWGCPAVSENSFNTIDQYLQNTNGRVLMWIID